LVAWTKIVEVIRNHGKTIIAVIGLLICVIWAWNGVSRLFSHGTTDNGSRVEIERSSDRQQLINESADEIEQRLETSTNATERIEQSNSDIKATIDRIEERSREGETILERDQRLIEECRNILADIRRQGQVER